MKATALAKGMISCMPGAACASSLSSMSILSIRSTWSIFAASLWTRTLRARHAIAPTSVARLEAS